MTAKACAMQSSPRAIQSAAQRLAVMFGLIAGASALNAGAPMSAHADMRLCNSTNSLIGVAIGYNDGRRWVSEGWWNVRPNSCDVILDGALSARFYYIYAVDYDRGGEWSGGNAMCTQDKEFVIEDSHERCEERGYHVNQFMEIDTGDQDSWAVQLTEPMRNSQG